MAQDTTGPAPQTAQPDADSHEVRVVQAWRLVVGLGAALVHQPFNPRTYDALRAYLDQDAEEVLRSLEALLAQPGDHEQIANLTRPVIPAPLQGGPA